MLGAPVGCWAGIPHVLAPDPRGVTVTEQAFEATLAQADAGTAFCLLACRDAALRSGTVFRLTLQNFAHPGTVTTQTKGGRWVTVPVSDRLRTLVEAARSARASHAGPDTPVYKILGMIQHRGGLKGGAMTRRLHAAQKRAGTAGWCWHDLRRTAAHRLYAGTRDLRDAQSLLGHQSLGTTLHYLWSEIRTLDPNKLALCASGNGAPNAR